MKIFLLGATLVLLALAQDSPFGGGPDPFSRCQICQQPAGPRAPDCAYYPPYCRY